MMGHDSISALPTGQIIGKDIYNDVESTLVIEITYNLLDESIDE